MKSVILAAGKGSRISEKIGGVPKSLLPLTDGTPILRRSIENMLDCGIEPVLCVGYKKAEIMKALEGLPVRYYVNPFYSLANNIATLWFAREEFDGDDIILSSADLYYPKDFLHRLIQSDSGLSMVVDSARITSGDFYFSVETDGIIAEYGPKVPLEKRNFEYMGLIKIGREKVSKVRSMIERYIDEERFDKYFEDIILSLNMKNREPIEFIDVNGSFWREFDFYEDYQAILAYEKSSANG